MLDDLESEQQFFVQSSREWLRLADGDMSVYIVKPQGYGPFPSIVLFMGMYGIDKQLLSTASLLAEQGYIVFMPDLYYQLAREPGTEDLYCPLDFDDALESMHLITENRCLDGVSELLDFIARRRDVVANSCAAIGTCLGGKWALLSACYFSKRLSCVCSYYAAGLESCFPFLGQLSVPLQIVVAGKDMFSGSRDIKELEARLMRNQQRYEIITYEDSDRGFLNQLEIGYDPLVSADALKKTSEFIGRYL